MTSVTIPDSVTDIGDGAFAFCTSLADLNIGNSLTTIGEWAFSNCRFTSVTIPDSVTTIHEYAFYGCRSLTTVTIPKNVTSIERGVFYWCTNLTAAYFHGDAPSFPPEHNPPFADSPNVTVYYLPGTLGWGATYSERPTAPWLLPNPTILTTAPNFGLRTNAFGFRISWATNASVVVEASTALASPTWIPVSTNAIAAAVG